VTPDATFFALMSALTTALATTLQQRGTLDTDAGENDPRFLLQVLTKPVWLLGGVLQLLGWAFQAVALNSGTFMAVQAICSLSLVFALPLGVRITDQHVGRRSVLGAILTLLGIVGFLVIGQPQGNLRKPDTSTLVLWLVVALIALVGIGWIAARRRGASSAALFGTAAGISFGVQAAATKIVVAHLGDGLRALLGVGATYVYGITALAGYGLEQSALKAGFLAAAMAATSASALSASVVIGVVVFGESIASSGHLLFALLSLAMSVVGVVILADPEPGRRTET
jgi:uncharacterized membrane protein